MLVKTYFNREQHPCNYEKNTLPSQTVPDQTMTIKTILERYARGLPIGGVKQSLFQDDEEFNDLPDPRTLDLSERHDLKQQYTSELNQIKNQYPKKTASPLGDGRGNGGEADALLASKSDGTELKSTN